jgi:hypothetical protein
MVSMEKTPMADLQKKAAVSLVKHGLHVDGTGGIKVYLVLDHSYSMADHYDSGAVQRLTEQVLALASRFDDDGSIEAWYFGSEVSDMQVLSLEKDAPQRTVKRPRWGRRAQVVTTDPYYEGWVDRTHRRQPWGSTNYVAAMEAVAAFHEENGEGMPGLVVFQTDGSPDDRPATTLKLRELSGEKLFWAFVGFGRKEQVAYLTELDEIGGRVRDNVSALVVPDFRTITDEEVYDGVLGEFVGQWLPQVL